MLLKSLSLTDFRSYARESREFGPGVNIIRGPNGTGKTNLLEAVYYLSCARSFRGARDRELIRQGSEAAVLSAEIENVTGGAELSARLSMNAPRQLRVNGILRKKVADFSGCLKCVVFSPDDLYIIKEGAAGRRRVMDLCLSQLRPRYASILGEYSKLADHKLRILREGAERPDLLATLPGFNDRLADCGSLLVYYRARLVRELEGTAASCYEEISGGRERLRLDYVFSSGLSDPFAPAERVREELREGLERHEPAERAACSCLYGPHKDDMSFTMDGFPMKERGSQGQIRSASVALRLAERELFRRDCGEYPLLLLDDVLSELDGRRREYVMQKTGEGQVLLTCCD